MSQDSEHAIAMDEITDIHVGRGDEDGFDIIIEGLETGEFDGKEFTARTRETVRVSADDARYMAGRIQAQLNCDDLVVDGITWVSGFNLNGSLVDLYIEPYGLPDDVEPSPDSHTVLDHYEISSGSNEILTCLMHSIEEVTGKVIVVPGDDPVRIGYTSICTSLERDDDGEITDINVPDEPHDYGYVYLDPGTYHMWSVMDNE
jgi:hypothetical protein